MPDHLHLFAGWVEDIPLRNWVQYWKSMFSKRHSVAEHKWQSGYWDTTMLSAAQYESKAEYMSENPIRQGLVNASCEWPYTGELSRLDWS